MASLQGTNESIVMIMLSIPYPPVSGNHFWKHAKGKHYLTDKAKDYYRLVEAEVAKQRAGLGIDGRLGVKAVLYPPDRRKRDMDNAWKVISDACTRAGVWVDDCAIDQLTLIRARESQAKGVVELRVWKIEEPVAQSA